MMNNSFKKIQDEIAFVTSFCRSQYPISVLDICGQFGIRVIMDKPLEKNGYLICQGGKKIILVDGKIRNSHRQNFIIAHELGHYLLHMDQLYSCNHITAVSNQEINSNTQEQEANAFASELLLPQMRLRKELPMSAISFTDISRIASLFDVSVTHAAMQSVLMSRTGSELLLCYERQRLKWYKCSNDNINRNMIPNHCPFDLREEGVKPKTAGMWPNLYQGIVKQEMFHPYGEQYLLLLSGEYIEK